MAVRVATTMDQKRGGNILTSEGVKDKAAWGKSAAWVDYTGPVEKETVGIAILNHPSSFRYPTYWHVRDYGLFGANPFGLKYFKGKGNDGSHKLAKGESIQFFYRIIFHKGNTDDAKIPAAFEEYKKLEKK